MTFPAMQRIASEATPVARHCVSSRVVYAVSSLVLHGGFSLMSLAPHQIGVVEDDALTSGAHIHSSSSQANTSAALSSQRANSAATACAAQLWSSLFVFMPSFGLTFNL